MKLSELHECLTYDDILLKPQYSEVLPTQTDLRTKFSKNIKMNIPIISSAMDTVTEGTTAEWMARLGGLGVIHKNLSPEQQAEHVLRVKSFNVGDLDRKLACVDGNLNLRVAAAMGVSDKEFARAELLIEAGVDALVIDTAHGHSLGVINMVKRLRASVGTKVDLVAGNVATEQACRDLIAAGVDGIKVGIGPGSICTTRIVAGIGIPQVTALDDCYKVCAEAGVPFIADGGVKFSGDVVKALALGASCVMIGSLFAGCEESPGEIIDINGKLFKSYRGMGSLAAMEKGSKDRYGQAEVHDNSKLVPEGVEGLVPLRGKLEDLLFQLIGGVRSGMGYLGAKQISGLKERAEFVRISKASYKESHVHDLSQIKDAPNYKVNKD